MNEPPPEPQDALAQQAPDESPVPASASAPVRGEIVQPTSDRSDEPRMEIYSGPLPDPETYRQLAEIIPSGAERIMRMAEKEQDAAIWAMKAQEKRANAGVFSALGVALGAFTVSGLGFYVGAPVGAFVRGTATHNKGQAEDARVPEEKPAGDTEEA